MPSSRIIKSIDKKQEIANAVTHGLGLVLSIIGVIIFLSYGQIREQGIEFYGAIIFSSALIFTYLSSTVYHCIWNLSYRRIFRLIDHISIYLLIAGSNTPFVLIFMNNKWGYIYLTVLWTLVFLGIILKIFLIGKYNFLDAMYYVFLGWMGLVLVPMFIQEMDIFALSMIGVGGISYTVGVYFYLKDHKSYYHAIWHLFVIGGSLSHYIAMLSSFEII